MTFDQCGKILSQSSTDEVKPVPANSTETSIDPSSFDVLMRYFDIDRDGCLSYDEMMYMLLPCTDKTIIKSIRKNI